MKIAEHGGIIRTLKSSQVLGDEKVTRLHCFGVGHGSRAGVLGCLARFCSE